MKKYEMTSNYKIFLGKKLFQIRALVDLCNGVKAGELGGYIEKEENLSQSGNAWVGGDARVTDNARVTGNAQVAGDAWVRDNAQVRDNAHIAGNAHVAGKAWVSKSADLLQITGLGTVHRTTTVYRTKNGIEITCGCFCGDLEQFKKQVIKTREGKVRDEYLKFAELIEIYFRL